MNGGHTARRAQDFIRGRLRGEAAVVIHQKIRCSRKTICGLDAGAGALIPDANRALDPAFQCAECDRFGLPLPEMPPTFAQPDDDQ